MQLGCGGHHCCAVDTEGGLACWGDDGDHELEPPDVGPWQEVSAGANFTCGIRAVRGDLSCWGDPTWGVFRVPGGSWAGVSAGHFHVCAWSEEGEVRCWGNDDQRLALGAEEVGAVVLVASGGWHVLALDPDGQVQGWGNDSQGQSSGGPSSPQVALAAGYDTSYALDAQGALTVWGDEEEGQSEVPGVPLVELTAGKEHACGLDAEDQIHCWGSNEQGQTDVP